MKKSIKRILAAVMAVMMVALMVPAVSAYTDSDDQSKTVKFTLNCTKPGFEFTVYELAKLVSTKTGKYTINDNVPTSVASAINTATVDGNAKAQSIIGACDAIDASNLTKVGDKFTVTADVTSKEYTVNGGIYYVKVTDAPNTKTLAKSSLVSLPYYTADGWNTSDYTLNLDNVKVNDSTVTLDKNIVAGGKKYAANSAKVGDVVDYEIEASVPGSATEYLTTYKLTDTLDNGLTYKDGSAKVYLNGDEISENNYTLATEAHKVTVTMKSAYLQNEAFYGDGSNKVKLTLSATVNADATTGNTSNNNTVALEVKNKAGNDISPSPVTVQTFVFAISVKKSDGADANKAMNGGKFKLYAADKTTEIASGSASDGVVTFKDAEGNVVNKVAGGKYYVQETAAPDGYVLDDTKYELNLTPTYNTASLESANITVTKGNVQVTKVGNTDGASASITINNYVVTPPKTGGMGTMMFTIGGASLIALAGVMFIVLRKKNTSK